jgi:hypothetical protein
MPTSPTWFVRHLDWNFICISYRTTNYIPGGGGNITYVLIIFYNENGRTKIKSFRKFQPRASSIPRVSNISMEKTCLRTSHVYIKLYIVIEGFLISTRKYTYVACTLRLSNTYFQDYTIRNYMAYQILQ